MSHRMGKPTICTCENKEADQHFCFHYTESTLPLHFKHEISSFKPASVTVQAGLYLTWLENLIAGFLMQRLTKSQQKEENCKNNVYKHLNLAETHNNHMNE